MDVPRLALVHAGVTPEVVVTFVRPDTKSEPPQGFAFVMEDSLSPGWRLQNDEGDRVPESVTPYQFRAWLITHGISMSQVDELLVSIAEPDRRALATVAWEYGLSVQRANAFVEEFGKALGMNDSQIDQAFREAAELI